jgi:hypothetical protein
MDRAADQIAAFALRSRRTPLILDRIRDLDRRVTRSERATGTLDSPVAELAKTANWPVVMDR